MSLTITTITVTTMITHSAVASTAAIAAPQGLLAPAALLDGGLTEKGLASRPSMSVGKQQSEIVELESPTS
eukprot:m.455418 g.455418  ORF g.455418 m.455418 type:complete len:71 (-) comp20866_c0_seq1:244-456(-)